MKHSTNMATDTAQDHILSVELELLLGLGPADALLEVQPGARRLDLHPWLLDCVAVRVSCLGHHEEMPRAWDWENVLSLLEPGEELLYVLDHNRDAGNQTGRPFTLWLAVRFPQAQKLSSIELDQRRKRVRLIMSQFQRQAFPGTDLLWVDPSELHSLLGFTAGSQPRCVCVSGLPSPRDLDEDRREVDRGSATRNYQSLNDVAESLIDLDCDYRIAFVLERVDNRTLNDRLGKATQFRDIIHPHVYSTRQAGASNALNWSQQESDSRGKSHSKGKTDGTQSGWMGGGGIGIPIGPVFAGVQASYSRSTTHSETESNTRSWTRTQGSSIGGSKEQNWSTSNEQLCSMLELADRSLDRTISALHEAHGTGGYRWAAFIFADGRNADMIGGAMIGVLAGARTKDYPFTRFPVIGSGVELLLGTEPLLDLVAEASPILPLPRACEALLLPEAELPGVRLRRNVFLGRTSRPLDNGTPRVSLGPDAFSALTGNESPESIEIPRQDLFRHILVAGTTGSGKTTRVVEILNHLNDDRLSVLIFETAKRTYRARLQVEGRPAPLVYSLGSSCEHPGTRFRPLRLNPFFFEQGTSLKRHIAVLSDALAELMPTEAMIGPLMRRAIESTYIERGWDIENGQQSNGGVSSWPTVLDFAAHVRALAQTLNYGMEVTANYRGALENRAALFVDSTFQDLFSHGGNRTIDELFPYGHDVIIEVEDLPPSEVDIRAFVMTLLLNRLRSVQSTSRNRLILSEHRHPTDAEAREDSTAAGTSRLPGETVDTSSRRWLVVIEEAHNVLDRSFEARRPSDESNAGRTLLRCLDRLLQEGREMEIGVMVVDQSPVNLARSVISNTGTKIVMRLEDGAEMEEIGRALGLDDIAWKKLGFLQEGEAIIKASYMDSPVKTARFTYTTKGPTDSAPSGGGFTPSYMKIENMWRPILAGVRTPDEQWASEVLAACAGKVDLATFVGTKLILESRLADAESLMHTREMRAMAARLTLSMSDLVCAAQDAYSSALIRANQDGLLAMIHLLRRSLLLPAAPNPNLRIESNGIEVASVLLAHANLGTVVQWRLLFLALSGRGGSPWTDACQQVYNYSYGIGKSDPTIPVRFILERFAKATDDASAQAATADPFDPVGFVLQVHELVGKTFCLHQEDLADEGLVERDRVFTDHVVRQLAVDLTSRAAANRASLVKDVLKIEDY